VRDWSQANRLKEHEPMRTICGIREAAVAALLVALLGGCALPGSGLGASPYADGGRDRAMMDGPAGGGGGGGGGGM
jgi:hypothetical protein